MYTVYKHYTNVIQEEVWRLIQICIPHMFNSITWLFAYCKGGNFNIHIWAWLGYLLLRKGNPVLFIIW